MNRTLSDGKNRENLDKKLPEVRIHKFRKEITNVDDFLQNLFGFNKYWYWKMELGDDYWKILGVHIRLGKFTFEMTREWARFYIRDNKKLVENIIKKIEVFCSKEASEE